MDSSGRFMIKNSIFLFTTAVMLCSKN